MIKGDYRLRQGLCALLIWQEFTSGPVTTPIGFVLENTKPGQE